MIGVAEKEGRQGDDAEKSEFSAIPVLDDKHLVNFRRCVGGVCLKGRVRQD